MLTEIQELKLKGSQRDIGDITTTENQIILQEAGKANNVITFRFSSDKADETWGMTETKA